MKKKPSPKKRSATSLRKQCVEIAKELAKRRDRYKCVRCGKTRLMGNKIDGSHVKPESHYHELSALPENIKAMCFTCHAWWHLNPTESGLWFKEKFPERWQELNILAKRIRKCDRNYWASRLLELKEDLNKIRDLTE